MPILNYTTSIEAAKTAQDIRGALGRIRTSRVSIDYLPDNTPAAVRFVAETDVGPRAFRLEPKVDGVLKALDREYRKKNTKVTRGMVSKAHATRVAWRILYDSVLVYTAEVEAGITPVDEAMFRFMTASDGLTTYQHYREQAGLPAPKSEP